MGRGKIYSAGDNVTDRSQTTKTVYFLAFVQINRLILDWGKVGHGLGWLLLGPSNSLVWEVQYNKWRGEKYSLNVFLECPESPPIDGHICNSPGIQVKLILREEIQSWPCRNVTTRSKTQSVAAAIVMSRGKPIASQILPPPSLAGNFHFVALLVAMKVGQPEEHH